MANKPQIIPAMAGTPAKLSPNHLGILLILLVGLVGLVLIIQLERAHRTLQDKVLQQTEQRGLQLAETIGDQIDGLISSIDLSLLQLRREWLRNETQWLRSPSAYDADVQRALSALPQGMATHLSIADASGLIVYNSLEVGRETRVDDRPHFRTHLSGGDRLAIGNPVQSRLFDGEWTFIVNRPLLHDGRFAGTINMSVSSRHIAERLGALRLSAEDTVTLVAADGTFLARSLNFQTAMGQRLPSDRPFLLENADINGIFLLPGQVDGIERIYAWHRIEPYGLFVIVGLSTAAVMEPLAPVFRRDHYMTAALIALLAAFGAISLFLLKRIIRQQREVDRNAAFRRSVFDSSPVPVLIADASTLQFIDCNPAAVAALGVTSAKKVLGTTLLDHSAEFQTDGIVSSRRFSRSIAPTEQGRATRFEWRQRRPNGEHWDAEIHVLPFQADGHALLQFTLRDISEQKHAQDAMATSEERLRQAMRISRLGLFDHDHVSDSIYWSPELREIYGVAHDAPFTLGDLASLIHPDDVELMLDAIHKAHDPSGNGTFDVSYRILRHDGQTLWLSSRAQTYFRDEGAQRRPLRTVGAVLDLTEQRAAEEALRRTNTVLAAVRHSQSQFMAKRSPHEIFNDLLKAILDITESAYGFIGELHHDEAGKPYLKAHGITNIAWNEETRRFYAENAPSGLDFRNLDNLFGRAVTEREVIIANDPGSDPRSRGVPRGHPAVETFMAVPFFENNELLGIIALANRPGGYDESLLPILEPVTTALRNLIVSLRSERQRLQAEQALQTLNADLEDRVEQRTADFRRAMEEAERANAAKSEFLSRMSHELRTPLNAILGFGQLLETDPDHLSQEQQANVGEILHAGRHLLDMINEVLDLARIESGRLEVSLEPVLLDELIDSCISQMRPLAETKRIALSRSGPSACVQADHIRLKQVLLNLLSNAVKYNFEDSTAKVIVEQRPGAMIRISVIDTGPGIPQEHLARLFKPFERLESAYQATEGTGIGLALCKRLTEAMHGTIGVNSTQGQGAVFWAEFPEATVDALTTQSQEAHGLAASSSEQAQLPCNHATVLCIEDNPANMKLVRRILASRTQLSVIEAESAEAGLIAAQQQRPHLILLDINLPGMNGFEALERLKENPLTRDIPVVALTANAMKRDIERAQSLGFKAYLTKPVDVAQLLSVVDELLA